MKIPDEPKRNYRKPDRTMLEQGEGFCNNFEENIVEFTKNNPDFDTAYIADFRSALLNANACERDREVVSEISLEVSIIEGYMTQGRSSYGHVINVAKRVYPNNPAMINTLGHKDYEEYNKIHTLLPVLLDQAFRRLSVPATKALFIAKGLTAAEIASLETISTLIKTENGTIYNEKSHRYSITKVRIDSFNLVWKFMSEISLCSKDMFQDDWAKRRMFLLYPEGEAGTEPPVPPVPPVLPVE